MTILVNDRNRSFAEKLRLVKKEKAAKGERLLEAIQNATSALDYPVDGIIRIQYMAQLSDAFDDAVKRVLAESKLITIVNPD